VQLSKSKVYSPTIANVKQASNAYNKALGSEGIAVAGCPVGQTEFVDKQARDTQAHKVVSQICMLTALELSAQDKLLILRKSLQLKMAHFARCAT
jgi:hypothetical protein